MKRFFYSFLLLLFFAAVQPSQAQVSFGVMAGLNFAELDDIDTGSAQRTFESRSGYHIGVYTDLAGGPLALRIGVRYLDAGPLFEDGGIFDPNEDEFNVNFVTVPVDLRFRMNAPFVKPYVFGGPEFRFLTDTDENQNRYKIKDLSMAANVGFGLQFSLGGLNLLPEFRYSFGLSGLNDQDQIGGIQLAEDQKVKLFMLSLGLGF